MVSNFGIAKGTDEKALVTSASLGAKKSLDGIIPVQIELCLSSVKERRMGGKDKTCMGLSFLDRDESVVELMGKYNSEKGQHTEIGFYSNSLGVVGSLGPTKEVLCLEGPRGKWGW